MVKSRRHLAMTKSKHDWAENLKRNEERFVQKACLSWHCSRPQAQTGAKSLNRMYELELMPKDVFNDQDGFNVAKAVIMMIDNGVLELPDQESTATETSASKDSTHQESTTTETSAPKDSTPTSSEPAKGEHIRLAVRNPSEARQDLTTEPEKADVNPEINARDGPPELAERIQADSGEKPGPPVSDSDKPLVIAESEAETVNQEIPLTVSSSTTGQDKLGDQLMKDQLRELKLAQSG